MIELLCSLDLAGLLSLSDFAGLMPLLHFAGLMTLLGFSGLVLLWYFADGGRGGKSQSATLMIVFSYTLSWPDLTLTYP